MMSGAAYIRVSTDDQTEYSPEAQLRALREYAKKNDILLLDEHVFKDEGISGRKADKRPGFQSMISFAKKKPKPFDVILVHKFDRFARNREDSVVYKSLLRKECDIKVVSITEQLEDDKFSIILESMLEAMAEYYSLNLAEEVKKGMFEKARRGENIGKAPYGYDLVDSKLVPNETESEIVKLIFKMYETESVTKITQHLNSNMYPTRVGGTWTQTTLIYILQNPVYYGKTRYNYRKGGRRNATNPPSEWIIADANHEPLITEDVYKATQIRLKQYANFFGRNFSEKETKSWLQHIACCSECGGKFTISSCDSKKYTMFRCQHNALGTCSIGNTLSTRKLEKIVLEQLRSDAVNIDKLTLHRIEDNSLENTHIDELKKRLQKIENKYDLVKKAFLAEIDSIDEYKKNKDLLKKEEDEIKREMDFLLLSRKNDEKKVIEIPHFLRLLENDDLSLDEKNKVAKQFIKEVCADLKEKKMRIIYYA